jgi:hypothetical protein
MSRTHLSPASRALAGVSPWTAALLAVSVPLVVSLSFTIWRTPFPLSEAVALFEDVARNPPQRFLTPDTSYYRPLFHVTLSTIWHLSGDLDARLAWIKLLHIVPLAAFVGLLCWHFRPRTALQAAAAAAAVAVAVGSPGFRDNLEIPLSYTAVGLPIVVMVWMLLEREPGRWTAPAVVLLTLVAIGFKEQGLVLVPLVVVAWWTRAPGATRGLAAMLVALAVGYIALRWAWHEKWPLFEQAVGLGFSEIEPSDAIVRFGGFPYWMYAYNSASTMANVLFSEPTRGVFAIVRDFSQGRPQPWELIHLLSSALLTGTIAWWGAGVLRTAARAGWTADARTVIGLAVVLLACGALSFNYSRDRLGGMAVPLYAIAAFHALRAVAARAAVMPGRQCALTALALAVIAVGWQVRAVATIEHVRITAARNRAEWLTDLPRRRADFAERDVYLGIMQSMVEQGTRPDVARPTPYPSRSGIWRSVEDSAPAYGAGSTNSS